VSKSRFIPILSAVLLVAACSSSATPTPAPAATPAPVVSAAAATPAPATPAPTLAFGACNNNKLTVWAMPGSFSDSTASTLITEFENNHPGCVVNYQVQQWNGIVQKLSTALASNNPPDVFEIGNTDAVTFEAAGVLADLSAYRQQLGGGTSSKGTEPDELWVGSLNDASVYEGKTYAVPFYAGTREIIYRKDLFDKSKIDASTLTSKAALIAAAQKLQADNPGIKDFSGLYLPGQNWYALIQMIWDNGGDIAKQDANGKWTATLDTPEAEKGIQDYIDYFKAANTATPSSDEATPPQYQVFQQGKVGMMIANGWEYGFVFNANSKTGVNSASQLDIMKIPSVTDGKSVPVFLGGSVLGVAKNSKNVQAAVDFIAELSTPQGQNMMIGENWIPSLKLYAANIPTLGTAQNKALLVQASEAAAGSNFTPNAKGWAAVEANNPLKSMLTAVLTGTPIDQAAKDANTKINAVING
jgi:N,N'-diacetylchitobiose transport system substrate-binding protein